jgi:hypothetical protein
MNGPIPIPDFVVVGAQHDGWVILLASNKMSEVTLKEELRYPDIFERYDRLAREPEYDIRLIAKVYEYVVVRARSYPEAWNELFKVWSPDLGSLQEISGRKEIGH